MPSFRSATATWSVRASSSTATIVDPDSANMSGAHVSSPESSDSLFLSQDDVLEGTGITLTGEGTHELTFVGDAPSATYERVLEAVRLDGVIDGQRELVFQVSDDTQGSRSEQRRHGRGHPGAPLPPSPPPLWPARLRVPTTPP